MFVGLLRGPRSLGLYLVALHGALHGACGLVAPPRAGARPANGVLVRASETFDPLEVPSEVANEATAPASALGVFGAASLVAGNMVGGGILAIPTVSSEAGFLPSSALLFSLWAANVGTGLLLGEVAAGAIRRGDDDVSLRTLSRSALGESGAALTSALFASTNLLLMGAYVAKGGDTLFGGLAAAPTTSPRGSPTRSSWRASSRRPRPWSARTTRSSSR